MIKRILLSFFLVLFASSSFAETSLNETKGTDLQVKEALRKINKSLANKYIYFVIPEEALVVGTDKVGKFYIDFSGAVVEVQASVETAPTGADLICDINKNGTTIWTTQGNRITVPAGEYTATQDIFNSPKISPDDYFTIDIDQAGSTVLGGKLVVRLKIEKNPND
jgi:hypothetical protein